jgi:hypothetical protein
MDEKEKQLWRKEIINGIKNSQLKYATIIITNGIDHNIIIPSEKDKVFDDNTYYVAMELVKEGFLIQEGNDLKINVLKDFEE